MSGRLVLGGLIHVGGAQMFVPPKCVEDRVPCQLTINDLQQATQNGPAIVSVKPEGKGAHALVVDSVQDGKVNIRDPWPSGSGSAYSLPVDEFQQSWNGGKGAVIP